MLAFLASSAMYSHADALRFAAEAASRAAALAVQEAQHWQAVAFAMQGPPPPPPPPANAPGGPSAPPAVPKRPVQVPPSLRPPARGTISKANAAATQRDARRPPPLLEAVPPKHPPPSGLVRAAAAASGQRGRSPGKRARPSEPIGEHHLRRARQDYNTGPCGSTVAAAPAHADPRPVNVHARAAPLSDWARAGAAAGRAATASSGRSHPQKANKGRRHREKSLLLRDGKRLSQILRHRHRVAGASPEAFAWHKLADVVSASRLSSSRIRELIAWSKRDGTPRYQLLEDSDGVHVRATYGHTVQVLEDDVLHRGNRLHRRSAQHDAEEAEEGEDEEEDECIGRDIDDGDDEEDECIGRVIDSMDDAPLERVPGSEQIEVEVNGQTIVKSEIKCEEDRRPRRTGVRIRSVTPGRRRSHSHTPSRSSSLEVAVIRAPRERDRAPERARDR